VLELHRLAHGYTSAGEALMSLMADRGIEPPESTRTGRWHEATHRKERYRKARYRVLGKVLMRRLFRSQILPHIQSIEDEAERDAELKRAWAEWQDELYWPRLAEEVTSRE
jgi:hypothetical protein